MISVNCLDSNVNCLLSDVDCLDSDVNCLDSDVNCFDSNVNCLFPKRFNFDKNTIFDCSVQSINLTVHL